MKTKEEILDSMFEIMPWQMIGKDLIIPYIKEAMDIYATIKAKEAFEHGKYIGHATANGEAVYGSGFEDKDINFDEWL